MNEALEQVDDLTAKYAELLDILKRPTLDGISDLKDWIKSNGKSFGYALDDLRHTIEHTAYAPSETLDKQLAHNAQLNAAVEMRLPA